MLSFIRANRPLAALALLGALLLPVLLWQTWIWSQRALLDALGEGARNTLELTVANLRGELRKHEILPQILASNEDFVRLLANPSDPLLLDRMNRYLEFINSITGTSDTYLMDATGLTLAASNWNAEKPFVGKNFSYRPYFQEAMSGGLGRYFALGTTSNKRGYYFAYPVRRNDTILGAVVVKMSLASLEGTWARHGTAVIVTDPSDVIFLSSNPNWRFKTLRPLAAQELERIAASRQYSDAELAPFPLVSRRPFDESAELVHYRPAASPSDAGSAGRDGEIEYLLQSTDMPEAGWRVQILSDTAAIGGQVTSAVILVAFACLVVVLSAAYFLQRRINLRERMAMQRQAQEVLETTVRERTADLLQSNQHLQREIGDRKAAEAELRQTQAELIQAGKLAALGQMSVGISHELNQPLAAIRSYADNAQILLARERGEEVKSNLQRISELTGRMAEIAKHLNTFARKPQQRIVPISLSAALDETLTLIGTRLAADGVEVVLAVPDYDTEVLGGQVRMQQVLLNLIKNALDAMDASAERRLHISVELAGESVILKVRDSGPGIDAVSLPQIFDPFFTTKQVGRGLGLGLSISYNIVKDFGGSIRAENHPDGGAVFTVELRRAAALEAASAQSAQSA